MLGVIQSLELQVNKVGDVCWMTKCKAYGMT